MQQESISLSDEANNAIYKYLSIKPAELLQTPYDFS